MLLAQQIDDDFGATTPTMAEVLVMPAREGRLDSARQALEDLDVTELIVPADSAAKLAQLRAATNLKMPDCLNVRLSDAAASRDLVVDRD